MTNYYSDLHSHSTLLSYNQLHRNTWRQKFSFMFSSQSDFTKLSKGKVRVVMLALYPIERGFLSFEPFDLGKRNITDHLARIFLDMQKIRADEIQEDSHE